MDESLSRRERKKMETRQRLMVAALELFSQQGFEDTTVEQITKAADVAKGTFFNYFETKELILPAVAEWRLLRIREELSPDRGAPASPVDRIRLLLTSVAEDPISDPRLTHHLVAAMHHGQPQPGRAFSRILAELVAGGQDSGEIRGDVDPIHLGLLIRAVFFQQMVTWHRGHRPSALRDQIDSMVDLLMRGIAASSWSQAE